MPKHVILVLNYQGESQKSKQDIVTEAKAIETKLKAKGYEVKLHEKQLDFQIWMNDNALSKGLTKIHIVAHGNQAQCGNYNGASLADYIQRYIKGKRELSAITIHSCMSASVHPGTGQIFVEQFAARLLTHLKGNHSQYIVVRGSDGESYTDSTGRNWVLKDGVEIPKYNSRERELVFLNNQTQDRGTARPQYAIHASSGEGYRSVDRM